MHELAVCQALIEQVERVARDHGARRVLLVTVTVGPLSGVEPSLLEHAYPVASAATVPVRVRCRSCGAETAAVPNRIVCGACDDWQVDVIAGDEMVLQRVELETLDEAVH
jgi:hydrogenase nickel incorporation protein HypA/HybF